MKLRENRGWVISANVVMCILSFLALAPFVLLIISSFTDETAALTNGYSYLPKAWSLHAYEYILNQKAMLGRAYMMTIVVTAVGTSVGVVMTAMLGYMLSQKGLPGRKFFNYFIVFTMLFNGGLVPTYIMYVRMLHIKNTIFGLIVPNMLMSSFMVMLVRNYFENSVPRDLYEACRIDGATEFQTFFKVALPLSTYAYTLGINDKALADPEELKYWLCWRSVSVKFPYLAIFM